MSKAPLLLITGYSVLTIAWTLGNPPFAAPDEQSHYVRALGLTTGDVRGRPMRPEPPRGAAADVRSYYAKYEDYFRAVRVPHGLMATGLECETAASGRSAACLHFAVVSDQPRHVTLMTQYQPVPYLLPAAVARLASSPFDALRLGRFASALTSLLLIGLGVRLLWSQDVGAASLTGSIVSLTPMTIFSASVLNPSGLEIAAGFAFAAALLRLARGDAPRSTWAAAAGAGAALALSRPPGPVWIALDTLLFAALVGRRRALRLAREARVAIAVVGSAIALSLAWTLTVGPEAHVQFGSFVRELRAAIGVLPFRLREEVGQFGWLDTPMPTLAVMAWQAMIVVLTSIAFVIARPRERKVLVVAVAVALALPVAFSAWFSALTAIGGGQGRHVLPAVIVLPLLAGELLVRNRERVTALRLEPLLASMFVVAAGGQLAAWIWNAHRFAVGAEGRVFFLRSPEWSPPLGWWPWLAAAVVGAALVAVAGFVRPLASQA